MNNTLSQPHITLCLYSGGILCGFLYDFFRIIRYFFHSKIVDAICDALFICAAAVLFAFTSFMACDGILRLYTIVSFLAGFLLEQFSISYFIFHTAHALIKKIHCAKS